MPLPKINFADVEQFQNLGEGEYEGHIEYIRFREAQQQGKFDQLSVCLVSDEEETKGEKTWQNLSFSPKALWRMAKFFGLFGIPEVDFENGISTDDPFDLLDPDLSGEPVRFTISPNGTYKGQPSFQAEVIEWLGAKPEPKPARKAAAPAAAEAEDDTVDADEATPAPAPAGRRSLGSAKAAAAPATRRTLR